MPPLSGRFLKGWTKLRFNARLSYAPCHRNQATLAQPVADIHARASSHTIWHHGFSGLGLACYCAGGTYHVDTSVEKLLQTHREAHAIADAQLQQAFPEYQKVHLFRAAAVKPCGIFEQFMVTY